MKLTPEDLICLKSPLFLKIIFKNNIKLFSEFLISLSKNTEEFTIISCIELTKLIKDQDEKELLKIYKAITPLLQLNDSLQLTRFEILLGIPQLTCDDSTEKFRFPRFGYHSLFDEFGKLLTYRGTMHNSNDNCGFIERLHYLKGGYTILMCELFLAMLESAVSSKELLKYYTSLCSQEPCNKE